MYGVSGSMKCGAGRAKVRVDNPKGGRLRMSPYSALFASALSGKEGEKTAAPEGTRLAHGQS